MRRTQFWTDRILRIRTPFDGHVVPIPEKVGAKSKLDAIERNCKGDVDELLRQLPRAVDEAKETLNNARRASNLYKARYKSGMTQLRKDVEALHKQSDEENLAFARSRCRDVGPSCFLSDAVR